MGALDVRALRLGQLPVQRLHDPRGLLLSLELVIIAAHAHEVNVTRLSNVCGSCRIGLVGSLTKSVAAGPRRPSCGAALKSDR